MSTPEKQPFPTDRDLILATLDAIGALALKLTGERLVVRLGAPYSADFLELSSSPASTSWVAHSETLPKEEGRDVSSRLAKDEHMPI
jgi:hypothetical protein